MKGRTICPKCKHEFILELEGDEKEHSVLCPNCNNKFILKTDCKDSDPNFECSWEEHGEPRKTILSKIKPKTNRPMLAAIILICVFVIGLSTSLFSQTFIETSLDVASGVGFNGSVKLTITDIENKTIDRANIKINGISGLTNNSGIFYIENVDLGIKNLEITTSGYKTYKKEIMVSPFFNYEDTIKLNNGSGTEDLIEFNSSSCTLIILIFSIFALLGSLVCLKRQYFDVAVVSSLIGIFSFGFFFIGTILSIIAFIVIIKSKDEFDDGKKGKTF